MSPMAKMTTRQAHDAQFPDIVYTKLKRPTEHPHYHFNGFHQEVVRLEPGYVKSPGRRPFHKGAIFERDIGIRMRDGIMLYADIFRPLGSDDLPGKVPAILPWSPYGKTGTGPQQYDIMGPFRCGIAPSRTTGYEKFEAPDPAEWTERGYAIVNIDARGAGMSEGDVAFWGQQQAEDIYDVISHISTQPWCNGSMVMAGNSWLAISQIDFVSRLGHPALKAIAPWEAMTDHYRQNAARGGWSRAPELMELIIGGFAGNGAAEDVNAMLKKRPLYDDYWNDKRIAVEKIANIPIYLTGSYSTMLHSYGSFETFAKAKTERKWLRVHPYQEWYDLYLPETNDELQKFYDFYAKGKTDNGWEQDTPPLRLSLIGFDDSPATTVRERREPCFPPPDFKLVTLYLDATDSSMRLTPPDKEGFGSHEAEYRDSTSDFIHYFPRATELAGFPTLTLFLSSNALSSTETDVVVQLRKISASGRPLTHCNYPTPVPPSEVPLVNVAKFVGPQGFLRASHTVSRREDPERDNKLVNYDDQPFYSHKTTGELPIVGQGSNGEQVLKLEVPIWPIGMVFAVGEGLMCRIGGRDMGYPETESLKQIVDENENNKREERSAKSADTVKHTVWTSKKWNTRLSCRIKEIF